MTNDILFLSESYLREANEILQFPPDITAAYERAVHVMRHSPKLCAMAVESHGKLLRLWEREVPEDSLWPDHDVLASSLGEHAGMFTAVVLISGLPKLMEHYRLKGIPKQILMDTMSDVTVWMHDYHRTHGVWGFENMGWLKLHMTGRLFRLGRLQFICDPFEYKLHVFRNIVSGTVMALSAEDIWYNREGFTDGNNDETDEGRWQSRFEVTEREIIGTPISPSGCADRNSVILPRAQWQEVLTETDPVLHVHIAEGSKMSHELCRESYRLALDFFPQYFPEADFRAFACGSWLLSPQFRRLLPESANIVRFLNDYYLFPLPSREEGTLERVFGRRQIDPATTPRDTALRRGILDYMAAGHRMISGGGFMLREDVQNLSSKGVHDGKH